jgi:hypothetical protein
MAELARTGLTIAGAWLWGAPGALLGGVLGSILFPPEDAEGPRLNELNFQQSTVGAPIPIVFGTAQLAGNVIWSGGLIETKHSKEVGGFLGIGGQDVTNYTYSIDLAVGICEGPISGIRRIWADADLIYDASDDATLGERFNLEDFLEDFADVLTGIRAMSSQVDFELYLGTEDQLPDPTIQTYENVNYVTNVVPAYRGLAYIVFNEFQLEKYGNRIPNFRFEVYSGTSTTCGMYSAGVIYPWNLGADHADPRNFQNVHVYYDPNMDEWTRDYNQAVTGWGINASAIMEADGNYGGVDGGGLTTTYELVHKIYGYSHTGGPNGITPCSCGTGDDCLFDGVQLQLWHNILDVDTVCTAPGGECDEQYLHNPLHTGDNQLRVVFENSLYPAIGDPASGERHFYLGLRFPGFSACVGDRSTHIFPDRPIVVRRVLMPPDSILTWVWTNAWFKSIRAYNDDGPTNGVTSYPAGPTLITNGAPFYQGDPLYDNEEWWTEQYNQAIAEGRDPHALQPGWTYGVEYPRLQFGGWVAECDTVDAECVPMASIVSAICGRAGLSNG